MNEATSNLKPAVSQPGRESVQEGYHGIIIHCLPLNVVFYFSCLACFSCSQRLPFPLLLQFSAPPGLVSAFLVSSVPVNWKPMFSQFKYLGLQLTSTTRTGLVKAWNNCRHSMIIGFFVCVLDTNFQVKENNTMVKK